MPLPAFFWPSVVTDTSRCALAAVFLLGIAGAAAAQTPRAFSLSISPSEISTNEKGESATVLLSPQNASFVGWQWEGGGDRFTNSVGTSLDGLFDNTGAPTAAFRNLITLTGAPAGLAVASAEFSTSNPVDGPVNGVHGDDSHFSVRITIEYSGDDDIRSDLSVDITVDASLLDFVDTDGRLKSSGSVSGSKNLTASLDIEGTGQTSPLIVTGAPTSLAEGGADGSYTVALRNDPGSGVTVTVTPGSGDTGAVAVKPASLSFIGGSTGTWQTPQTVTVEAVDDADGSDESVFIDHAIAGIPGQTSGDRLQVKVTDDETPSITVFPTSGLEIYQDAGASYRITLGSQPLSDVAIATSIVDAQGNADARLVGLTPPGASVPAAVVTLTFTPSDWAAKTVQVAYSQIAGAGAINHTVSTADPDYRRLSASSVGFTSFASNKVQAALTFAGPPLQIAEGKTNTYTVRLTEDPGSGATVTVTPTSGDTGAVTVSPATLSFTGGGSGTWNTAQTVTVEAVLDSDDDNESVTVTHPLTGLSGVNTGGEVSVSVTDTVEADISVDPTSVTVNSGETASYTVSLAAPPSSNVTISVSSNQAGRVAVASGSETLTFTPGN